MTGRALPSSVDRETLASGNLSTTANARSLWRRSETVQVSTTPKRWTRNWPAASGGGLATVFVGLIAAALCLPFIRYVSLSGDEGVLLHGAERMLRGDNLYNDFFEFLPPGGFIITELWFRITGISILAARILFIMTIVLIASFTYLNCRQVSKQPLSSAFFATGSVLVSQPFWMQMNHHWFAVLFSTISAWAAFASIERPKLWLRGPLMAGTAAGAAVMVTPSCGTLTVLAGSTAFISFRRTRGELIMYALGCAVVPISLMAYLIGHDSLKAAFNDVVLFTSSRYTSIQRVPFGYQAIFPLKWVFPIAALLLLFTCIYDRRSCLCDRALRTSAAFALAGFIGCFPRPDGSHLGFSLPLVCPLLTYCTSRLTRRWPPIFRHAFAIAAIASLFPAAHSTEWWARSALRAQLVPMSRGEVAPLQPGGAQLAARIATAPPEDRYFFYPWMPILPFLTARRHEAKYDLFAPGYTLMSHYKEACISAMRDASWLVIDRELTDPKFFAANFPAIQDPQPPETQRFEQALQTGFELIAREGVFELRRRVRTVDESICITLSQ